MVASNVTIRINIGIISNKTTWNQNTYITQINPVDVAYELLHVIAQYALAPRRYRVQFDD